MESIINLMHLKMTTPTWFGWFHILCLLLTVGATVLLCLLYKKGMIKNVSRVVLVMALIVIVLEIYKQLQYSFSYDGGVVFDYQWYAFPFQFCSTPMYVGLLAGLCVMVYPNDIYIDTVGINIQTSVCHGTMISVAVYLLYSGYVELKHKTILKAMSVFACAMGIAMILNEIAYRSGLEETFNMFYISPHHAPSLPVYSQVQAVVPFPFCTLIYFAAFTLAAYVILLTAMGIAKLFRAIRAKKTPCEPKEEIHVN